MHYPEEQVKTYAARLLSRVTFRYMRASFTIFLERALPTQPYTNVTKCHGERSAEERCAIPLDLLSRRVVLSVVLDFVSSPSSVLVNRPPH